MMSRRDCPENIFLDDVDRQEFLKTLDEAWQKTGLEVHETDAAKWRMALRLRAETTLTIGSIAERLNLGTAKRARVRIRKRKTEAAGGNVIV